MEKDYSRKEKIIAPIHLPNIFAANLLERMSAAVLSHFMMVGDSDAVLS